MFRITTVPRTAAVALTMAAAMLSSSNASAQAPDPNLARNLAASCANCHGTNGNSVGGMASLAGMPKDAMIRSMQDFKSGKRPATIMHQLSKGYTDQQIELLPAISPRRSRRSKGEPCQPNSTANSIAETFSN